MDYLRSCYSTAIRYEAGDPTKTARISWYFVDGTCKGIAYDHCFGSLNWTSGLGNPLVGEVEGAPRPYRKGQRVGKATSCSMTAPADWWLNGQPPGTPPLATAADGTPLVCLGQNVSAGGGLGGGEAILTVTPHFVSLGGGIGGGSGTLTALVNYPSSGGVMGSGTPTQTKTVTYASIGGKIGGGSAAKTTSTSLSAIGGGGGGGSATEDTMSYPISATIWPDEFVWSVGTGPVPFKTDNALYNGFSYASTHANGDTCKAQFFLKAGTYTLHQLGILDPAAGIVVWYVDGVAQGSGQNWYAGSLTYNVLKTVGITVIGDGPHELMGVLTGKDGSSTSYYLELIKLWIQ